MFLNFRVAWFKFDLGGSVLLLVVSYSTSRYLEEMCFCFWLRGSHPTILSYENSINSSPSHFSFSIVDDLVRPHSQFLALVLA